MLYIIATPIGNLADISYRAVETLKKCDYILCEDTRHSRHLLQHYEIDKPLKSFHRFSEAKQEETLIEDLRAGLSIGLISDAGTPTICDPGYELVRRCREENLPISSIPGACAVIVALTLSGFDSTSFQFVGFLPKKEGELNLKLTQLMNYEGTSIAYESPHRIEETLDCLGRIDPTRNLCVARELTKLHEEALTGTAEELKKHFEKHPPRGEIVLLIQGREETINWDHLSIKEHVQLIQKQHNLSISDAIKMVAQLRGVAKREIYQLFHED